MTSATAITTANQLILFEYNHATLDALVQESLDIFNILFQRSGKFALSFSGGKDSHALLAVYIYWMKITGKKLDMVVVFADTKLESRNLMATLDRVEKFCSDFDIEFIRTQPLRSFWMLLFGWGYPLPSWKLRWCTRALKVQPIERIKRITLTGVHYGESARRDHSISKRALNSSGCGSNECGATEIKDRIEPIVNWRNCHVWDWIAEAELLHGCLPEGTLNDLQSIYVVAQDEHGSTRMGCEMCPVIAKSTLQEKADKGISSQLGLTLRGILDQLIEAKRLPCPKGGHGAIHVDERIKVWVQIRPLLPQMVDAGLIAESDILEVELALKNRTYPPSYSSDHVSLNECLAYRESEAISRKKKSNEGQSSLFDL
jgi:3'-phosphoadenosine 5'-phosphosulfate sulfotransferase (PAPS reductase)/FAD synthetase